MRNTLFIRLLIPATPQHEPSTYPVEWCVWEYSKAGVKNASGKTGKAMPLRRGSLLEASLESHNRRVVAIVPNQTTLVTQVDLPPKAGNRIQQIIPFLLEDQIADDISQMHFATASQPRKGQPLLVAVINKAQMQLYIDLFAQTECKLQILTAPSFCIPNAPNTLGIRGTDTAAAISTEPNKSKYSTAKPARRTFTNKTLSSKPLTSKPSGDEAFLNVLVDNNTCWLRGPTQTGLCIDTEMLPVLLQHLNNSKQSAETKSDSVEKDINISANTVDHAYKTVYLQFTQASDQLSGGLAAFTEKLKSQAPHFDFKAREYFHPDVLTAFAEGWQEKSINLLQNDFSQSASNKAFFKHWGIAASFVLAIAGLATVQQSLHVSDLEAQNNYLRSEINREFSIALPNTRKVDARAQIEQALNATQQGNTVTQTQLLQLIDRISGPLKQNTQIKLQQVAWRNDKLELEVTLPNIQLIEALKQQLETSTNQQINIGSSARVNPSQPALGYKVKLSLIDPLS